MKKALFGTVAALGIVACTALPSGAAPAGSAGIASPQDVASCPNGYSCYYDGAWYTGQEWIAPSPGCFYTADIGMQDKISSVENSGGGTVHLYDWNGRNAYVNTANIPVLTGDNLSGAANNTTDKICID